MGKNLEGKNDDDKQNRILYLKIAKACKLGICISEFGFEMCTSSGISNCTTYIGVSEKNYEHEIKQYMQNP